MDSTLVALGLQQTQIAVKSTEAALLVLPSTEPTVEPVVIQPTIEIAPTIELTPGEPDYSVQITNAKVLLYEDTTELGIGNWISDTLDRMGISYTNTSDSPTEFLKHLNSSEYYDLIIIGGENHTAIQGEFWDSIMERVNKKTAVIAEVYYLDMVGNGKIKNFTSACGVSFEKDWSLADSIYWVQPEHPVLNQPNKVLPLLHYNRYWTTNAGDMVKLRSTGDAQIVGAVTKFNLKNGGLITTCMEGRTVLQTFCNHDFHRDEIMNLWENYITYTLTNHFIAVEGVLEGG